MEFAKMFIYGYASALLGAVLCLWLFPAAPSVAMVFLASFCIIPYFYTQLQKEEQITEHIHSEKKFFEEYGHMLYHFMAIFIGLTLGFFTIFLHLDPNYQQVLFGPFLHDVQVLQGFVTAETYLANILWNNVRVLLIGILLSLCFGFGAIILITWNAALVGVAMGQFFTQHPDALFSFFNTLLRYMPHGIFEIAAYFIGAFGGGILFMAIAKHKFKSTKWKRVVLYAVQLFIIALFLLVFAAFVEVFITPWLYVA
ncbi:MAG: stage II sporulation protein M [Candidatus Woesearchaeota archaeon]